MKRTLLTVFTLGFVPVFGGQAAGLEVLFTRMGKDNK